MSSDMVLPVVNKIKVSSEFFRVWNYCSIDVPLERLQC